jgi:hypothetical protein
MRNINTNLSGMLFGLLVLSCAHVKETPTLKAKGSVCINALEQLPSAWRPSIPLMQTLDNSKWTSAEQEDAHAAVWSGLEEMIAFQEQHPTSVTELWDNSVEAYIDVAYGADHQPKLKDRALDIAIKHFDELWTPHENNERSLTQCDEVSTALTLVVYAHNLSERRPENQKLVNQTKQLIQRTNQSISQCGSLSKLMTYEYSKVISKPNAPNAEVYDMVMWSIIFIDALRIKALQLPAETRAFVSVLWRYLATYPMPAAVTFKKGANDSFFYDLAYLITHVGYIPTGYGRHQLTREHGVWLHQFIRTNFYAVMEMGELDLTAEFVDLIRQYGCTETNDRQVRDGTRHLMKLYQAADQKWMNHRESYETKESNPYDLLHKPWTAIAGLRSRQFEKNVRSSYGHLADSLLQ